MCLYTYVSVYMSVCVCIVYVYHVYCVHVCMGKIRKPRKTLSDIIQFPDARFSDARFPDARFSDSWIPDARSASGLVGFSCRYASVFCLFGAAGFRVSMG